MPTRPLKYDRLKEYFGNLTDESVTLTFTDIESIIVDTLPPCTKDLSRWTEEQISNQWTPRGLGNHFRESWLSNGYIVDSVDVRNERVTFIKR